MAKTKVNIKISSGKPPSGTKVARYTIRFAKTTDKSLVTGKPIYRPKAQLHTRIYTTSDGGDRD